MKMKNMLIGGMSLALVACISVGATLAYLSDMTSEVRNTFTMGDGIALELKEHTWGENGDGYYNDEKGEWSRDNTTYNDWDVKEPTEDGYDTWGYGNTYEDVVPGMVLPKDPTVKLVSSPDAGAEVYVLVDGIDKDYVTVDIDLSKWAPVTTETANGNQNGVYRYIGEGEDALVAGDTDAAYAEFFSAVTVKDRTWEGAQDDLNITLYAFACQKDNLGEDKTADGEAVIALNKVARTNFTLKTEAGE